MILVSSDYDKVTGFTTEVWSETLDNGKRRVTIRRLQDVTRHLEENAKELNSRSSKRGVTAKDGQGLGAKVASIPFGLVEQLRAEGKIDILTAPHKDLKKLLNDSEYSKLRTAHGRL